MVTCVICAETFQIITNTHLGTHGWTLAHYVKRFGSEHVGFVSPNLLAKSDPRYKAWRASLKKRPRSWSLGHTKHTHPGVAKISRTFQRLHIDNFKQWRERAKRSGLWQKLYPPARPLPISGDLAEYIGVVLGDGNIHRYPRTEGLVISCNSNNPGFIHRYALLTRRLFGKTPLVRKVKGKQNVRIRIYQQDIARRLGIPTGDRGNVQITIPQWILRSRGYRLRLLRGLFEAEGSLSVHLPTCTYNFQFSNKNVSLLRIVESSLRMFGYHPEVRSNSVRLRRRQEVEKFRRCVKFREYS